MQVQTQINNLPLKLNCSSIASSTPGNNMSSFQSGQLIKFQQFTDQPQQQKTDRSSHIHKKRLTIQINDSYDFNPSSVDCSEYNIGVESSQSQNINNNICFFKKQLQKNYHNGDNFIADSLSPSFAASNSEIDIEKILSFNFNLQQKIKLLQQQNSYLNLHLQQQKHVSHNFKSQNDHLKLTLKKKQETILTQKQRNNKLQQKIAELQEQKSEHKFYDQKLRQKQFKIQQLQRKLQKITLMNKTFQRQLKQSDKKIMQLEKDLQKTFCQNQHDAINRIKQSSVKIKDKEASLKSKQLIHNNANKQNLNHNNMMENTIGNNNVKGANTNLMGSTIQMRKSIQKKKGSQSQGKKKQPLGATMTNIANNRPQRTSSSSNIVSKKLLIKKQ